MRRCAAVFTAMIRPMLDDLFISRNESAILWMPVVIVGLFIVRGVATYVADYGLARIGRDVVETLRGEVFARYLVLPAAYFDREPSGQMISRLTYTVEQVAQASTNAVKVVILDSLTVIGLLGVMLYHSAHLTLMLFVHGSADRRRSPGSSAVAIAASAARSSTRWVRSPASSTRRSAASARSRSISARLPSARASPTSTSRTGTLNLKIASTNALSTSVVQMVAACALALVIYLRDAAGDAAGHESGHVHVADHGDADDAAVAEAPDHRAGDDAARRGRGRGSVRGDRFARRARHRQHARRTLPRRDRTARRRAALSGADVAGARWRLPALRRPAR